MKPELSGITDMKWLLKANPAYAEQKMRFKIMDQNKILAKKKAA